MPVVEDPVEDSVEEEYEFTEEEKALMEQSYVLSKRLNELRTKLRRTARETYEMTAIERQLPAIEKAVDELCNKKK